MRSFPLSAAPLWLATALLAQDPASTSTAGPNRVELAGTYPVVFRLHDATYALAIEGAGPRDVPSREEKLLVLDFEVEHIGTRSYGLSESTLRLAAIDEDEHFGEAVYDTKTEYRLAGTSRSARGTFRSGQTRRLYTGVFVAAGSTIDALELSVTGGEPVRIPLEGRIQPLAPALTDTEGRVPELIPAHPGQPYAVGAYDLTVEPVTRDSSGPDTDRLLVPITVRNRSATSVPLNRGQVDAYLADNDGERHKVNTLLKGSEDRATGLNLAPDQTVNARLQFVVPKAFQPTTLTLSSPSGRAQGHRYQFDLAQPRTASSTDVLGKYVPGRTSSGGELAVARPTVPSGGMTVTSDAPAGSAPPSSPAPNSGTTIGEIHSAPTVNLEEAARQREADILGSPTSSGEGGAATTTATGASVIGTAPRPTITATRELPTAASGSSSTDGDLTVLQEDRTLADEGNVQFAPLPVTVSPTTRDGLINFRRLAVSQPVAGSSGGDSPYLYVYWFRGRLGEPGGSDNIFVFDRQIYTFGGYDIVGEDGGPIQIPGSTLEGWARKGTSRDIASSAGRHDFSALKPYEIYGGVIVIMDWAPGASELRKQRASAINGVLLDRWNRVTSGTQNFDFTRREATTAQSVVDQSLQRLDREFLSELSEAVRVEAERNRNNAAYQNEDRYIDTVACFWINLPASDSPALQPDAVKTRLVQSRAGAQQAHWAAEYVRVPGDHSLPAYQQRHGNLQIGYITSGRIGPSYQISTGIELGSP